jgi:hypothetical protein
VWPDTERVSLPSASVRTTAPGSSLFRSTGLPIGAASSPFKTLGLMFSVSRMPRPRPLLIQHPSVSVRSGLAPTSVTPRGLSGAPRRTCRRYRCRHCGRPICGDNETQPRYRQNSGGQMLFRSERKKKKVMADLCRVMPWQHANWHGAACTLRAYQCGPWIPNVVGVKHFPESEPITNSGFIPKARADPARTRRSLRPHADWHSIGR